MVEPRARGEADFGEWVLLLVEMGICGCDGCGGHLGEEGRCGSCGCLHRISARTSFTRRHAYRIPVYEEGRCADADACRAERRRERDRQAMTRVTAEELGDPQR